MVSALDMIGEFDLPSRCFVIEPCNVECETDQLELSDFVSSKTGKLFVATGFTDDFRTS